MHDTRIDPFLRRRCAKNKRRNERRIEQGEGKKKLKGAEEKQRKTENADKREEQRRSPVFTGSRAACKTMQAGVRQKKGSFLEVSLLQHLGKLERQIKPRENP
ncbi:hypothetical protein [Oxalicibacterium solurbis]|uniref:hypothetical protein n=1 Tax=Oxalicibacterium solurbis TaxID=69280 RepID=UPI001666B2BD|nr:hypothetical protein [Oxalicibacterium solurbis]